MTKKQAPLSNTRKNRRRRKTVSLNWNGIEVKVEQKPLKTLFNQVLDGDIVELDFSTNPNGVTIEYETARRSKGVMKLVNQAK